MKRSRKKSQKRKTTKKTMILSDPIVYEKSVQEPWFSLIKTEIKKNRRET
jgi:hypothetical protein